MSFKFYQKKHRLKALIFKLLFIMVSLSACTERAKPLRPHEADKRPSQSDPVKNQLSGGSHFVDEPQTSAMTSLQVIDQFLYPLANRLLVDEVIFSPSAQLDPHKAVELDQLNRIFLKELDRSSSLEKLDDLLERYVRVALLSCEKIVENCPGIRFFRRAANSAQIIKRSIKIGLPLSEYYRRLGLAMALKNQEYDAEIFNLAIQRQSEFGDLVGQTDLKNLITSIFEFSIMSLQKSSLAAVKKHRDILEKLDVWKLIFGKQIQLSSPVRLGLIQMVVAAGMIDDASGKQPSGLKNFIASLKNEKDSFWQRQDTLLKQQIFLSYAMGLNPIREEDEYFFLIDRLFYQALTVDEAMAFLSGTNKDQVRFSNAMQNYVRTQFLYSLYLSTQLAQKKIFKVNLQRQQLLSHALNESVLISEVWNTLRAQLEPLYKISHLLFSDQSYRSNNSSSQSLNQEYSIFGGLEKSIKMMAVYPHMMILFYLLSKDHFELYLPIMAKKLYSSDLTEFLYNGELPPIFQYTQDKENMTKTDIIYSFDFAIRTNIFSLVEIDPDDYISDTLQRLSERSTTFVNNHLNLMQSRFRQSSTYNTLKRMCTEFRSLNSPSHRFYLSEVVTSPYYGNLIDQTFFHLSNKSGASATSRGRLGVEKQGLNYFDRTLSESLEKIRLNLNQILRMADAMRFSYVNYLKKTSSLSLQEIEQKTKKTNKLIAQLQSLQDHFLNEIKQREEEIGDCFRFILLKDSQMKEQVLKAEQAYLRQVYRDIIRLRDTQKNDEKEKQKIKQKYLLVGMPNGFAGLDRIDEEGYFYHSFQLWIRIAKYLSEGLKTDQQTIPPLAPNIQVDLGNSMDEDLEEIRKTQGVFLSLTDTEDEFVRLGMRVILADKKPMLWWQHGSFTQNATSSWLEKLLSLNSLYRMRLYRGHDHHPGSDQKWSWVKASDLIEEHRHFLQLTRFTEFERAIYSNTLKIEKHIPINFKDIMLDYSEHENKIRDIWGLFDLPALLATSDVLGFYYSTHLRSMDPNYNLRRSDRKEAEGGGTGKLEGVWSMGKDYYQARTHFSRRFLLIPIDKDLDHELETSLRDWIQWEIERQQEWSFTFDRKMKEYRELPEKEQIVFDLNINRTIREPLLNQSILQSYKTRMQQFHRETGHCYLLHAQCPDFQ